MSKIPFVVCQLQSGCIISTSHPLNHDGYLRICRNGRKQMAHRFVWEEEHGPIPEGYEIDHVCKNRACFNLEHLQMLDGREHTIKGNMERYYSRYLDAFEVWFDTGCSGRALADRAGVTNSTACRWIRMWKRGEKIPK